MSEFAIGCTIKDFERTVVIELIERLYMARTTLNTRKVADRTTLNVQ